MSLAPAHPDPAAQPTRSQSHAEHLATVGQLSIRSQRHGGQQIIAIAGELDLAAGQALTEELTAAEATDTDQIVLDLSGLDFIDSSGLHVILAADARSRANGNRLSLLRGPPRVQRIFDIVGITDRLSFADWSRAS